MATINSYGFVPALKWYNCGDVVSVNAHGFISIKSRLKRFAKISGEMISLDAIEKLVESCFGDGQYTAVTMNHPKKGEMVVIYTTVSNANRNTLREFFLKTGQSMLMLLLGTFGGIYLVPMNTYLQKVGRATV